MEKFINKLPSEFKVVIIGSQGVGKTCITRRYCTKKFSSNGSSTIGSSYFSSRIIVNGQTIKLHIWDTAGQEKFRSMTPIYYRNTNAAIIVFDITSFESFRNCDLWLRDLQKHVGNCILSLVGNKCDLINQRQVPTKKALQLAEQMNARYFETSAKNDVGIDELFQYSAIQLVDELKSLPIYKLCNKPDEIHPEIQEPKSQKSTCC